MDFALDAPLSVTTSAYEKAHRIKSTVSRLPSRAVAAILSAGSSSNSFLEKASEHIRQPFHRSNTSNSFNSSSLSRSAATKASKPVPAAESPFFHLPLELRETIYGLVVGRREMFHIMMKRRSNRLLHPLVHRRCRAGGNLEECILHDCKRFLDGGGRGLYFGSFNSIGGLLFSCRDIFQELSNVLYTQNTFEFDHPLSLIIFQKTIHPSSFNSIKSISINMQRDLYFRAMFDQAVTSLHHDVWPEMWNIIARMESLEQVRVTFQFPLDGWLGWSVKKVLDPLWEVTRPMRVFEVECKVGIAYRDGEYAAAPFKFVGIHFEHKL